MLPSRVGQHDNCSFVVLHLPRLQKPVRRSESGAVRRVKCARTSSWDSSKRHRGNANEKNNRDGSMSHHAILRHNKSAVKETIKVHAITRHQAISFASRNAAVAATPPIATV